MGKRNAKLHLDMPFDEALERYAGTNPAEIPAPVKRGKAPRKGKPKRKTKSGKTSSPAKRH